METYKWCYTILNANDEIINKFSTVCDKEKDARKKIAFKIVALYGNLSYFCYMRLDKREKFTINHTEANYEKRLQ